jgi:transmembrane sensor
MRVDMSERETPEAIYDRAVEWVASVDRSRDDPAAKVELECWLAGDPRRRGAYFRAQAAWAMLDRASVLGSQVTDDHVSLARRISRRQMVWGGGAIAASGVIVASGIALWSDSPVRIETATGEIRRVPLADGTLVAVNTRTTLGIDLKPATRRIVLDRGEAWFEVAHDRSRPFIVEAGDVRVKAVGTAFSVRRSDGGASVQVTDGVVEVWSVGDVSNIRRVSAGARTFVSNFTGPQQARMASPDIDRSLAWRSGQLIFDGETLGEAAAEFNRYNVVQVRISDPALASEKFVGRFHTNEPDAFARAAATILGARDIADGDTIILSRN